MQKHIFPIIGMSPGNSFFKDDEIRYILGETLKKYGCAVIFIADIPAISTYKALGYSDSKAREKAVLKGNNLKNKVKKAIKDIGVENDIVRIIEWKEEIENNDTYRASFATIEKLFRENNNFRTAVMETTRDVLINTGRDFADFDAACLEATHYLLSELAFLDFASEYLDCEKVVYVYHRQWGVYEKYLAGFFDTLPNKKLGFHLLQTPDEIFEPLSFENSFDRVNTLKQIEVGFIEYPPAVYKKEDGSYGGLFVDIMRNICKMRGWELILMGKTGYGAAIHGLDMGRFDLYLNPTWPTDERRRQALFTQSLYTSEVFIYSRHDIDFNTLQGKKDMRIAALATDIQDSLSREYFPHHPRRYFSQLSRIEDLLIGVSAGEADCTFCEEMTYNAYLQSGGKPLFRIQPEPAISFENCMMMRKGDNELCDALNASLDELTKSGYIREKMSHFYS